MLQIGSKFGLLMHDITSKVPKLATRLSHIATLPWNAFLSLSVSIQFVSSSAGVKSVKFHKRLSLTQSVSQLERTRHIDRTRRPGSDKNSVSAHYVAGHEVFVAKMLKMGFLGPKCCFLGRTFFWRHQTKLLVIS